MAEGGGFLAGRCSCDSAIRVIGLVEGFRGRSRILYTI